MTEPFCVNMDSIERMCHKKLHNITTRYHTYVRYYNISKNIKTIIEVMIPLRGTLTLCVRMDSIELFFSIQIFKKYYWDFFNIVIRGNSVPYSMSR